jgi:polar amino acid transport system permease protein
VTLIADNLRFMIDGVAFTLRLAFATLACATVVSLTVGLMSVARASFLRLLALGYVEFWRDIPLLVNLLFVYFGAPLMGIALSPFAASVVSLSLWGGANGAEIVRGGIKSVSTHQMASATALGLKRWQIYRFVILPQALMPILPPMTGLFASLIQATSLASLVGVTEFFRIGQIIVERTTMQEGESPAFLVYGFVLAVYFLICSCLTQLSRALERRLAARGTRVVAASRGLRESV